MPENPYIDLDYPISPLNYFSGAGYGHIWGGWGTTSPITVPPGGASYQIDFTQLSHPPTAVYSVQIRYFDGERFVIKTITPLNDSTTIDVGEGVSTISVRFQSTNTAAQ